MRSNGQGRLIAGMVLGAAVLAAQEAPLPNGSININLAKDSPVSLLSMTSDQSRAMARGAAMVLDLHLSMTLKNIGANRIHGLTMRVVSQEVTMGGKGSVSLASLNIGPGEIFPVRIDMQLVRPTQIAGGPLVQVDLDGVLYQDLSFYGPDSLRTRRILTACEKEAQRDREHFKRILAQGGKEELRRAILGRISRDSGQAPLNVKVIPHGQAVTSAALPPEHSEQFAMVTFPDSPVQPVDGSAQVAGNQARTPHVDVINKSNRLVRYVEVGWILSDQAGRQSIAASLPSGNADLNLSPGKTASVRQDTALELYSIKGQPTNVQKMTGYIKQVQFNDGEVWIPSRQSLQEPELRNAVAPSAEEQRLAALYLKNGIDGLVEELKKF